MNRDHIGPTKGANFSEPITTPVPPGLNPYVADISIVGGIVTFVLGATFAAFFQKFGEHLFERVREHAIPAVPQYSEDQPKKFRKLSRYATAYSDSSPEVSRSREFLFTGTLHGVSVQARITYQHEKELQEALQHTQTMLDLLNAAIPLKKIHDDAGKLSFGGSRGPTLTISYNFAEGVWSDPLWD